ncbi:MAG: diguanylate cyclase [Pseudomonadota bacterium]
MRLPRYLSAFWRGSIRRQLVLGFALASLALMTVFGMLLLEQQRATQYQLSTDRATSLAHALSISSASWAAAHDLAGLQEVVQGFARTTDMQRAYFLDREGEVLASTNPHEIGFFVRDPLSRKMLGTETHDQLLLVDTRSQIVVAHPVLLGGRQLGWIRVEMTRDSVNANLAELMRYWLLFAPFAVVMVSLVAMALARRLTLGLHHLMRVAAAVEQGRYRLRADIRRSDEIGRLGQQIDRMLDALDAQQRLISESEAKYRFLADNISDVIWVYNLERARWEYVSPSVQKLRGYSAEEAMSQSLSDILAQASGGLVEQLIAQRLQDFLAGRDGTHVYTDEIEQKRRDSSIVWTEVTTHFAHNPQGEPILLGVSRDISERKKAEEQIRNLAFYDPLTQLPNRRLLLDRFDQVVAACKRSQRHAALMFIDLDNFKPLNDAHGHDVGDLLLIEVARRILSCVRKMDTVARFGGDEFVVMLHELSVEHQSAVHRAMHIAEKIRQVLGEAYRLEVAQKHGDMTHLVEHHCTASIGVVLFDQRCESHDDLLRLADDAMYQAKQGGRNQVRFLESRPPEHSPS